MIRNYYYLVAGILAILFSVTHALNGQRSVLPSLNGGSITEETKTTFFYVWHILTAENMLFGVAFLVMSVHKNLSKVRFTAWLIAILMIVRWIVIAGSTLLHNTSGLKNILADSIAIIVFTGLIIAGARVKDKRFER